MFYLHTQLDYITDTMRRQSTLRIESNIKQNDVLFAAATVPLQTFVNI